MANNSYKKTRTKNPRDWPQMRMGKRESKEDIGNLIKIGEAMYPIQDSDLLVIKLTEHIVPYFSAGIYTEGNKKIASVNEIFGKFDDNVFCSIKIESKLSSKSFLPGAVFKADKFRCLGFEKVKGASQVPGTKNPEKTNKFLPVDPIKRSRSSKYRTNAQNERIKKYAEEKIRENNREFRNKKKEFLKKTVEKRGDYVKMNKKVKYTDE